MHGQTRDVDRRLPWLTCLLGQLLLSAAARAESPLLAVALIDDQGRTHSGQLESLESGRIVVAGGKGYKGPTTGVVKLSFLDREGVLAAGEPLLLLANGDLFVAEAASSNEEAIQATWARLAGLPKLQIPLEAVRALVFQRPANPRDDAHLFNRLFGYAEPRDLLLLTNGDQLVGQFESLTEKQLTFEAGQKVSLDRAGLLAVAFNAELASLPPLAEEGALISLTDGSRFHASKLKLAARDRLEVKLATGPALQVPLLAIESMRFLRGCAVWLSELAPQEYKFEPFLGLTWPLVRDRSVVGGPLRLRGVDYPRGLGMHSRSEVTYELNGKYRKFLATVGIDDDANGLGCVTFEVRVDGKSAYRSPPVTGKDEPITLQPIDLTGARRLTLLVDFAAGADILDHADWCDAVLLK